MFFLKSLKNYEHIIIQNIKQLVTKKESGDQTPDSFNYISH